QRSIRPRAAIPHARTRGRHDRRRGVPSLKSYTEPGVSFCRILCACVRRLHGVVDSVQSLTYYCLPMHAGRRLARRRCALAFGVLVCLFSSRSPAFCEPSAAGRIKLMAGAAVILREGTEMPAKAGAVLFENDTLRTGADGRVAITLKDDTRFSLDP